MDVVLFVGRNIIPREAPVEEMEEKAETLLLRLLKEPRLCLIFVTRNITRQEAALMVRETTVMEPVAKI